MKKKKKEPELLRHITLPIKNLTLPRYDNPPQIEGDWAVCSDVHVPHYSELWISRIIEKSKELDVKNLFISGDFYNFESSSTWPISEDSYVSVGDEKKEGLELIKHLRIFFDRIMIIPGNHDLRLWRAENKAQKGRWKWEHLVEEFYEGAEVHSVPYTEANLNGQTNIVHAKNYSHIPVRVAARLANENLHSNVISSGGHEVGIVQEKSGRYWGADLGHMMDVGLIAYYKCSVNLFPAWKNGFIIVKNIDGVDRPFPFNDSWTHFKK
jgi:hypothetical protein